MEGLEKVLRELVGVSEVVFLLRKPQTMAKSTSTRLRESQLFFTVRGLKMLEANECNVGTTMSEKTSASTRNSTRRDVEVRKRE